MFNTADNRFHFSRRETLWTVGAAAALAIGTNCRQLAPSDSCRTAAVDAPARNAAGFWPNNARLAVSLSLMFEGGGHRSRGRRRNPRQDRGRTCRPTPSSLTATTKASPACSTDGKARVKLSSFMIGKAVETSPDLAREIVRRGHEAAAHGRVWDNSYRLSRDEEKRFISDSVETIRRSPARSQSAGTPSGCVIPIHILKTLQDLGFLYHIDEPSHDEPFIIPVRGRDFCDVPYTFHMNDIVSFPFEGWNPAAYEQALRDEFDQLYEEGAQRRRMMVIKPATTASPATPAGFAPSTASLPTRRARRASGSLGRTRLPAGRSIIAPTRPSSNAARRT